MTSYAAFPSPFHIPLITLSSWNTCTEDKAGQYLTSSFRVPPSHAARALTQLHVLSLRTQFTSTPCLNKAHADTFRPSSIVRPPASHKLCRAQIFVKMARADAAHLARLREFCLEKVARLTERARLSDLPHRPGGRRVAAEDDTDDDIAPTLCTKRRQA